MNVSIEQKNKIKQLKNNFRVFSKEQKKELKTILRDSQTYRFEKSEIKTDAKMQINQEKKKMKAAVQKIQDPEFFKRDAIKRNNEQKIVDLQITYYNDLKKLEKKLKRVQKIKKETKAQKQERKEKIKLARQEIVSYQQEQKPIYQKAVQKIKLNSPINQWRTFKTTTRFWNQRTYDKVLPIVGKFTNQKHLLAIRNAFGSLSPIIIAASFLIVIVAIPVGINDDGSFKNLLTVLPQGMQVGVNALISLTMGLMAIGVAVGVGINLGEQDHESPVMSGIMGFFGFVVWIGVDTIKVGETSNNYLPLSLLGAKGVFVALLTSILMFEFYRLFRKYNLTIKLPKQVPPTISGTYIALFPAVIYIVIVFLIRYVANFDLINVFDQVVQPVTSTINNQLGFAILICLVNSVCWWLGMHGGAIVQAFVLPAWMIGFGQNMEWFQNGMQGPVPNLYVETFFSIMWTGGGGSIIGLAIVALLFAKSKQNKLVARTSFIPSIFNVSEPVMFGFPVILNFYFLIPFLLAPVVICVISSFLMTWWGVGFVAGSPMVPTIIAVFFASGDNWKAIIIVLIAISVASLIYYPFFKIYDQVILRQERNQDLQEATSLGLSLRQFLVQREAQKVKHQK